LAGTTSVGGLPYITGLSTRHELGARQFVGA
jgi:hypothetical protein